MLDRFTGYKRLLALAALNGGVSIIERTATGNPLVFLTDLAKPLKSLLIPFTPVQSGTGDPSPQNVRPIVPWEGLKVWNGGKNLFDVSTVVNGTLDGTGALVENNNRRTSAFITLTAGKYKVSRNALVDWWKAWSYKLDGTPINELFDGNGYEVTLTLTETCKIRISFDYVVTAENEVQLEARQTATAYEPYVPITETDISFPSPVYGGTLDVVTGELWANWIGEKVSEFAWVYSTYNQANAFTTEQLSNLKKAWGDNPPYIKASCFKSEAAISSYSESQNKPNNSIYMQWSESRYFVKATDFSTVSAFVAEYGDQVIAYELASPVLITTLTPQQITALLGDNTIWSDADGSMTAVYLLTEPFGDDHPISGGLGSGLLGGGFGSGTGEPDEPGDPDEPGEPDDDTGDDQPADDQPEEQ